MPNSFIDILEHNAHKKARPSCAHNRGVVFKGQKLQKKFFNASSTAITQDYVSGIEYRNGIIEAIYFPEGRIAILPPAVGTTAPLGRYEYSIKDHLGNTRLTFADLDDNKIVDVPSDILQEQHYYPFGLGQDYTWMNNTAINDTKYLYNGKELNDEVFDASKRIGLNWLDFGKRWYDPATIRFPSPDPIIEKFAYLNSYNYASNNPVTNIDLWGLQGVPFQQYYTQMSNAIVDKTRSVIDAVTPSAETQNRVSLAATGVKNMVMGSLLTIVAVGTEPLTSGASTLALPLTIGEVAVGFVQTCDACLGKADADSPLQKRGTIPGMALEANGSKYAGKVDAITQLIPGFLVPGGNLVGGASSGLETATALKAGEASKAILPALNVLDAIGDVTGGVNAIPKEVKKQ
jgi:RHS repeat-associated protein